MSGLEGGGFWGLGDAHLAEAGHDGLLEHLLVLLEVDAQAGGGVGGGWLLGSERWGLGALLGHGGLVGLLSGFWSFWLFILSGIFLLKSIITFIILHKLRILIPFFLLLLLHPLRLSPNINILTSRHFFLIMIQYLWILTRWLLL